MAIEQKSYLHTAIRLCLDGQEKNRIYGSLHSSYCDCKIEFTDLATMLVKLDWLLELRGFPKSSVKYRGFLKKDKEAEKSKEDIAIVRTIEEINQQYGKLETITLYVTSRQNAGIQGHFVPMKTGNVYKYSSELMLLQEIEEYINAPEKAISASV